MAGHVSIHDVSPVWSAEGERAIALCSQVGARPALLVVPNYHRSHPLLDHAEFCERLRELQARGHEVYLHGFFHEAAPLGARPSMRERARWFFAQRIASG